jgi:hypothetical protein
MWSFIGDSFSWSRSQDGKCRIRLFPNSHSLSPNLIQQYPDFEHDEVSFLNGLTTYIVISEGGADDLIRSVKANHRFASYSAEDDEIVEGCNASVSLIDNQICVEFWLPSVQIQFALNDLLVATGRADGYYLVNTGSKFLDLTRSFGVKPEGKARFLAGDLSAILWGGVRMSFGFGDHSKAIRELRERI